MDWVGSCNSGPLVGEVILGAWTKHPHLPLLPFFHRDIPPPMLGCDANPRSPNINYITYTTLTLPPWPLYLLSSCRVLDALSRFTAVVEGSM